MNDTFCIRLVLLRKTSFYLLNWHIRPTFIGVAHADMRQVLLACNVQFSLQSNQGKTFRLRLEAKPINMFKIRLDIFKRCIPTFNTNQIINIAEGMNRQISRMHMI